MAALLPIAALHGKERATEGLMGDIFVRRTSKVVGKGKKAQVVDSTLHINPVVVGVGAGVLLVSTAVALYALQLRVVPGLKQKQKWVVDTPGAPQGWVVTREAGYEGGWVTPHYIVEVYDRYDMTAAELVDVGEPKPWGVHHEEQRDGTPYWTEVARSWAEEGYVVPAVAEVGHWEPDGDPVKRFSIEQRRAFSMGDILDDLKPDIGAIGKNLGFKPIFGDWSKGKVFSGKWF